jgi:hypothetical protein
MRTTRRVPLPPSSGRHPGPLTPRPPSLPPRLDTLLPHSVPSSFPCPHRNGTRGVPAPQGKRWHPDPSPHSLPCLRSSQPPHPPPPPPLPYIDKARVRQASPPPRGRLRPDPAQAPGRPITTQRRTQGVDLGPVQQAKRLETHRSPGSGFSPASGIPAGASESEKPATRAREGRGGPRTLL